MSEKKYRISVPPEIVYMDDALRFTTLKGIAVPPDMQAQVKQAEDSLWLLLNGRGLAVFNHRQAAIRELADLLQHAAPGYGDLESSIHDWVGDSLQEICQLRKEIEAQKGPPVFRR